MWNVLPWTCRKLSSYPCQKMCFNMFSIHVSWLTEFFPAPLIASSWQLTSDFSIQNDLLIHEGKYGNIAFQTVFLVFQINSSRPCGISEHAPANTQMKMFFRASFNRSHFKHSYKRLLWDQTEEKCTRSPSYIEQMTQIQLYLLNITLNMLPLFIANVT